MNGDDGIDAQQKWGIVGVVAARTLSGSMGER